jgi:hypothetical protein
MAMELIQPIIEMRTRNIPGVKRGRSVRLANLPLSSSQVSRKCENLDVLPPFGPPRRVIGIALLFYFYCIINVT